jgi:hypothetical protein
MLKQYFLVNGDALIYGELAKNLLLHGRYGLDGAGGVLLPTLIRLPGYPLFLALCFRIFGMENYASACWVQIGLELAGCLLLADFARRIVPARLSRGAAHCTLWLAALCPFTAIYAATPLTESLTLFTLALAMCSAARFCERPGWGPALCFTFAVTYAALLRPDGALVGVALAPALVMGLWRRMPEEHTSGAKAQVHFGALMARLKSCPFKTEPVSASNQTEPVSGTNHAEPVSGANQTEPVSGANQTELVSAASESLASRSHLFRMAAVCALVALMPFVVWSWRNWQVFHVFEPLAPRYANDPGQETYPGWQRWVKSWCLDFVCTYDVYWPVPGSPLDLKKLPSRAFDSPEQYAETAALASDYNDRDGATDIVPDVDARFGKLADERIAAHPLRYYVWLPLGRVADMWLRPRVENLNIDMDWWVYSHHREETRLSWANAGLNALYLLLGVAGLWLRPQWWRPMLAYMLLRSVLLMTVEAPETRYTIECFPMLFALGGVALYRFTCWVLLSVLKLKASDGRA